ncbi:MAG: hypothetical protein CMI18_00710 [Opitutaceae bacterium]|nr:hypothetical protein [Opitutaceae bacterium]|tara:strand:- start:348 stop:887 length:540 start_codon:yes stop_codon:yes gene_type:complete
MTDDPRLTLLKKSLQSAPYSGRVTSLCARKDDGIREYPDRIDIDVKEGVVGDRWIYKTWKHLENGYSDPRVQVAVCNSRILELLQKEKNNDYHPGDNIVVDHDLSKPDFEIGNCFRLGKVILQVSDVFNDACAKFAGEFGADVLKWINIPDFRNLNLRGIYCKTVQGGGVKIGDKLRVL